MAAGASSSVFLHYFTTVFDHIEDAVLLVGVGPGDDFTLLMCNEAFARNSGHSRKSVGKKVRDIVHPTSYPGLAEKYRQVVAAKQAISYEEQFQVPLGKQCYDITLLPVLNAIGECRQILAITRNITELRTLQNQLSEVKATLAQLQKQLNQPLSE